MINWKGFGTRCSWPNFTALSPGGIEENNKNFSKDSKFPHQDLNK
jgi:hypothetical protein